MPIPKRKGGRKKKNLVSLLRKVQEAPAPSSKVSEKSPTPFHTATSGMSALTQNRHSRRASRSVRKKLPEPTPSQTKETRVEEAQIDEKSCKSKAPRKLSPLQPENIPQNVAPSLQILCEQSFLGAVEDLENSGEMDGLSKNTKDELYNLMDAFLTEMTTLLNTGPLTWSGRKRKLTGGSSDFDADLEITGDASSRNAELRARKATLSKILNAYREEMSEWEEVQAEAAKETKNKENQLANFASTGALDIPAAAKQVRALHGKVKAAPDQALLDLQVLLGRLKNVKRMSNLVASEKHALVKLFKKETFQGLPEVDDPQSLIRQISYGLQQKQDLTGSSSSLSVVL